MSDEHGRNRFIVGGTMIGGLALLVAHLPLTPGPLLASLFFTEKVDIHRIEQISDFWFEDKKNKKS